MTRATGVGGVFLRAADPEKLHAWYEEYLGIIDPKREDHDYGRFAWFNDPEGNRVEFWQPPGPAEA